MGSDSSKTMLENMEYTLSLADKILLSSNKNPLIALTKAVGTLAQVIHIITPDEQREETMKSTMSMLRAYLSALVSDLNNGVLDAYMASHGDYVMTPSRHSVVAGGLRGLEQRRQITIERDPTDPTLEGFFQDLDLQVVSPTVPDQPTAALI